MNAVPATPIREMFDALVPEYDRFNRISSLGLDVGWRRELTRMFQPGARILDVGTGTGDLAKELAGSASEVIGVDFAEKMVAAAADKLRAEKKIQFQVASADDLPFGPRSFDGIASAFVVRNLHHGGVLGRSFREFFRVLRPGGQMVHLELARPPRGVLSWGHQAYLKLIARYRAHELRTAMAEGLSGKNHRELPRAAYDVPADALGWF